MRKIAAASNASRRVLAALIVGFAAVRSAGAAEDPVRMRRPATTHIQGVPPLPAIAAPIDAAQRRINAALAQLDTQAASAARQCVRDGGRDAKLSRRADVTMNGPGFLSYLITDEVDCGGAHPYGGAESIVYDLTTGAPVDWARLLPSRLVGAQTLGRGSDGARMVTLTSQPLYAFYLAHYAHDDPGTEQNDCLAAVRAEGADGPPPMTVWLDARAGGLAMQFQLENSVEACAEPVVVPSAVLLRQGANSRLVSALEAARARYARP